MISPTQQIKSFNMRLDKCPTAEKEGTTTNSSPVTPEAAAAT